MTNFKHSTIVDHSGHYRGKVACIENGRKLWEVITDVQRLSAGDALRDAQGYSRDVLYSNFMKEAAC